MLRLCSTYLSTFSSKIVYVSIVLDLCFDCAWSIFDCAPPMFRLCSTYVLTMLGLCFDCARPIFRLPSACVLTTLGLSSDCDRPTFDCARPVFWMCSNSVSTLLDLSFDCAQLCLVKLDMFQTLQPFRREIVFLTSKKTHKIFSKIFVI